MTHLVKKDDTFSQESKESKNKSKKNVENEESQESQCIGRLCSVWLWSIPIGLKHSFTLKVNEWRRFSCFHP
jgi:hypothetical protein